MHVLTHHLDGWVWSLSLGQIHVSSAVEKLPDGRPGTAEAGHGQGSALHLSMSRVRIGSPIHQKAYDVQGPAAQSSALARCANGSHPDQVLSALAFRDTSFLGSPMTHTCSSGHIGRPKLLLVGCPRKAFLEDYPPHTHTAGCSGRLTWQPLRAAPGPPFVFTMARAGHAEGREAGVIGRLHDCSGLEQLEHCFRTFALLGWEVQID